MSNLMKFQVYDAGSYFSMAKYEEGGWHVLVNRDDGLSIEDEDG